MGKHLLNYIDFRNSLDLTWEEAFSLDYGSGFYSYWEIRPLYLSRRNAEIIKSFIPLVGIMGLAHVIYDIMRESTLNRN